MASCLDRHPFVGGRALQGSEPRQALITERGIGDEAAVFVPRSQCWESRAVVGLQSRYRRATQSRWLTRQLELPAPLAAEAFWLSNSG
jgi:hypothetical protein